MLPFGAAAERFRQPPPSPPKSLLFSDMSDPPSNITSLSGGEASSLSSGGGPAGTSMGPTLDAPAVLLLKEPPAKKQTPVCMVNSCGCELKTKYEAVSAVAFLRADMLLQLLPPHPGAAKCAHWHPTTAESSDSDIAALGAS